MPSLDDLKAFDDSKEALSLIEIGHRLGDGSASSAVWSAFFLPTSRPIALKKVEYFDSGSDDSEAKELEEILTKLKSMNHPNLLKTYGSIATQGDLWIVLELLNFSATDVMRIRRRPFDEQSIALIAKSLTKALEYLHSENMVHRGVKASNCILSASAPLAIKLAADCGVIGQLSRSKKNTVIGSPFWLAPETIQDSAYDSSADIWALGITLIELAQMEPPYAKMSAVRVIFMIPSREPPKPRRGTPHFVDFIGKCLAKVPDERASCSKLLTLPFVAAELNETAAQTSLASALGEASSALARVGRQAAFGIDTSSAIAAAEAVANGGSSAQARGGADGPTSGGSALAVGVSSSVGSSLDRYGTLVAPIAQLGDDDAFIDQTWQPDWIQGITSKEEVSEFLKLSEAELKARIASLEEEKAREIAKAKAQIQRQKIALQNAIKKIPK